MGIVVLLGFWVVVAACASRDETACYVDTPEGKKPCKKEVVRTPVDENQVDSDGDRIPDNQDLCPHRAHLGSPDGCAPHCLQDDDSDSINNCADSCPQVAGIAEAQGCTETTLPFSHDYYRLVHGQSFYGEDSGHFCRHLVQGRDMLWTDGMGLHLQSRLADTLLATSADNSMNLCVVRHAVQLDHAGRRAVLWSEAKPGEAAKLYFQRFDATLLPIDQPLLVDTFPLPNLGPAADNTIGALALLPGNDAVVSWVNRDQIFLRRYPVTGMPADRVLINVRDVSVEKNITPDVSADAAGHIAVVWQEGTGTSGPIRRAIMQASQPDQKDIAIVAANGRSPTVALNDGAAVYAWDDQGVWLKSEEKTAAGFVASSPVKLSTEPVFRPALWLDSTRRLIAGWAIARNDASSFRIFLQDFASVFLPGTTLQGTAVMLEDTAVTPWLSLNGADDLSPAVLFSGQAVGGWQLENFIWQGSEAPHPHAALFLPKTSVEVQSGKATAVEVCNRGAEPLTVNWQVSSGFFLLSGFQHLQTLYESILPSTCSLHALAADGSHRAGGVTL